MNTACLLGEKNFIGGNWKLKCAFQNVFPVFLPWERVEDNMNLGYDTITNSESSIFTLPLSTRGFFLGGGDGGNLDPPFFAELAFKISVHPVSSNDEKQLPSKISSYVLFLLGF